jgi:hypothetical protein
MLALDDCWQRFRLVKEDEIKDETRTTAMTLQEPRSVRKLQRNAYGIGRQTSYCVSPSFSFVYVVTPVGEAKGCRY